MNGELHITEKRVSIQQSWSMSINIDEILETNGNFRELNAILGDRKPLSFEYDKLKKTLTDFVEVYSGGRFGANGSRLARSKESEGVRIIMDD